VIASVENLPDGHVPVHPKPIESAVVDIPMVSVCRSNILDLHMPRGRAGTVLDGTPAYAQNIF
jgi:hypothetical protein